MEPTNALIEGLLTAAPDALLAVDEHGVIVYLNDQVENLFGWSRSDLLGRAIEVLVPERFAHRHPALRAGYVQNPTLRPMGAGLELSALRRDGSEFPAEISLSAVLEGDSTLVLAAIRDITDRVALEGERREMALEVQRESSHRLESLGQLAGGVAHDFNNLLGVILNYATLIERAVDDPVVKADLAQIQDAADRGAALTRQLLTFAHRDVVEVAPVDVVEVIRGLASMVARALGEHIRLDLDLADPPLVVLADRHQLEQVLLNLAINARDAMPDAGALRISAVSQEGDVVLQVVDNGLGMAPAVVSRAFEPFFTTKARDRGTGLGLATVYGIVQRSGGQVTLDSVVGEGTTVTIRLPASAQTAVCGSRSEGWVRGGSERILLVEDEEMLRIGTARLLRASGYDVVAVGDGQEAVRAFEREGDRIDLVLTDLAMPRMRGDEFVRWLDGQNSAVPCILMSGYDFQTSLVPGRLLPKPIDQETLLRAVREALDE